MKEINGSEDFSAPCKPGVPAEFQPRNLFCELVLELFDKKLMHSIGVVQGQQTGSLERGFRAQE